MAETLLVDEINEVNGVGAINAVDPTSRILTPTEGKTDDVSRATLDGIDVPHPSDRLDPARVADLDGSDTDPHPALVALKATLLYELQGIKQLKQTENDTKTQLQIIDQLLDLSSELAALKDTDKHELSAKMQLVVDDLKDKGVDLLKGDSKTITKEQLIELKSAIGSRVDKCRTEVQQIFTKMQNIIQNMMSVNDSGKRMISEFVQLLRTITKNMRP
jgi:hypothetical protein